MTPIVAYVALTTQHAERRAEGCKKALIFANNSIISSEMINFATNFSIEWI